jgi:hypothetical protein
MAAVYSVAKASAAVLHLGNLPFQFALVVVAGR